MTDRRDHRGSCLCGEVTFAVSAPLRPVLACHCSQCRKTSGHYWVASSVPLSHFRLLHAAGLRWFRASATARRGFCAGCGSSLFWEPDGERRMAFAPGALDGPTGLRLEGHFFTEDAGDYYAPEGPPPPDTEEPKELSGSCLCGAMAFTLPGPAGAVTACHCRQCRKTSGHYAARLDADETRLTWTRRDCPGEYRSPGGGTRGFCRGCGSSLWFRAAAGAFSVEAGCLSAPTGGRLAAHIFVTDKGDYYDLDDGLPHRAGHA